MRLLQAVEVDDARIQALTPEAFRLVFEARGWKFDGAFALGPSMLKRGRFVPLNSLPGENAAALALLANDHHGGATFDAFVEVERVQSMIETVEKAERGEWYFDEVAGRMGAAGVSILANGTIRFNAPAIGMLRLWPRRAGRVLVREGDRERAAREARAQLPRLVRIICGVEWPA